MYINMIVILFYIKELTYYFSLIFYQLILFYDIFFYFPLISFKKAQLITFNVNKLFKYYKIIRCCRYLHGHRRGVQSYLKRRHQ